ncbi:hypothetical protein OMAG_000756 [Candidatus Omnitrophus magneticus]|uniref:CdsD C-terminal domain-containing protein n=1 Tax=Candidatus Omnitrophus magneticus TaxID=1609969 RepID=A0A0F0CV05_9BACT|nr:hypothetical protein OMAG_000756 [Candidatus Omnitrophus magneticus]
MSIIAEALKKAQEEKLMRVEKNKEVSDIGLKKEADKPSEVNIRNNSIFYFRAGKIVISILILFLAFGVYQKISSVNLERKTGEKVAPLLGSEIKEIIPEKKDNMILRKIKENILPCENSIVEEIKNNISVKANPVVTGIMYNEVNPSVIINGKILAEGESVDGYTIYKILHDKIILKSGGKEISLTL